MAASKDFVIEQGRTFYVVVRWETEPVAYVPITNIQKTAPVRITAPAHGLTNGWRVAVTNAKGMTEINAEANAIKDKDYHPVTIVDGDTIELNDVNAMGFKAYTSGGVLQYNSAMDLFGFVARMNIKDKIGGTTLLDLSTTNNRIVLDNINKTIALKISASDTAALAFKKGVYDLELESPLGVVTSLLSGAVTVTKEVTTS